NKGYKFEEGFNPSFEVEGLDVVGEKVTDIENFKDVKRMLDEVVNDTYSKGYGKDYEVEKEHILYRSFEEEENIDSILRDYDNHGTLVGIYTIKRFDSFDEDHEDLLDEYTYVAGLTDIF